MNICKEIALIIIVCIINIFCGFFVEQNKIMKNTNENLSKTEFKQKSNHSEVIWGIVVFILLTVAMVAIAIWRGV